MRGETLYKNPPVSYLANCRGGNPSVIVIRYWGAGGVPGLMVITVGVGGGGGGGARYRRIGSRWA